MEVLRRLFRSRRARPRIREDTRSFSWGHENARRSAHKARDHPSDFYSIVGNDDGTVNVYFPLSMRSYAAQDGFAEHDITVSVVEGVEPWEGMEDDIRARYYSWRDAGKTIVL